jgi:hypothetical protein
MEPEDTSPPSLQPATDIHSAPDEFSLYFHTPLFYDPF